MVLPYQGVDVPDVSAVLPDDFSVGADRVEVTVQAMGRNWVVGRDLSSGEGWCR